MVMRMDDLISRQAAMDMESIKKQLKELLDQAILDGKKTTEEVAEYLAESNVIQGSVGTFIGTWISVNNCLPHAICGESDIVLTINRFGNYNLLFYDGKKWRKPNGELCSACTLFEVTHWMLLSEPQGFKPWRKGGTEWMI